MRTIIRALEKDSPKDFFLSVNIGQDRGSETDLRSALKHDDPIRIRARTEGLQLELWQLHQSVLYTWAGIVYTHLPSELPRYPWIAFVGKKTTTLKPSKVETSIDVCQLHMYV